MAGTLPRAICMGIALRVEAISRLSIGWLRPGPETK